MARQIEKPSIQLPDGYEMYTNYRDTHGKVWRVCAYPMRGGSIALFDSLVELRRWCDDVEEIRAMQEDRPTRWDRWAEHAYLPENAAFAEVMARRVVPNWFRSGRVLPI